MDAFVYRFPFVSKMQDHLVLYLQVMSAPISVLLINGPNLNLLGTREPHVYGYETLQDVVNNAEKIAKEEGAVFAAFQSNHEGAIVDRIQQAKLDRVDGIVINPGKCSSCEATYYCQLISSIRRLHAYICCHSRCTLGCRYSFYRAPRVKYSRSRGISP